MSKVTPLHRGIFALDNIVFNNYLNLSFEKFIPLSSLCAWHTSTRRRRDGQSLPSLWWSVCREANSCYRFVWRVLNHLHSQGIKDWTATITAPCVVVCCRVGRAVRERSTYRWWIIGYDCTQLSAPFCADQLHRWWINELLLGAADISPTTSCQTVNALLTHSTEWLSRMELAAA